ncbi:ATP-dependent chaperone [Pyrenophora tritici-repentis Pt-1C-BFP]|uniref:ATP-dependent chaperone n=1 Tax=Pyrenophora tritici-repentis (strain Pt-1C-BFP) TaxID=426418 RepID=B2WN07_PYRTR|nr:ATP-dependent chaperone [Pyrenophora tritici-repentis Pt-1C-BFP]EDU44506.1 ATP-dependent chaperone [Pyrenophora tritici-repentis Pt-1C-BFP]
MSNPFGSDFDEVEHQREMIRKMNMRKLLQPKATATEQEPHKKQVTVTPPATFQSWVFGIMNGGQDSWLMRYMESEFYELARKAIKDRTGGDIHMVMMGCAALNAARVKIPAMLSVALTQVKSQVTSSIAISAYDSPLIKELFQIAREKSEEFQSLKLRLSGEHHLRKVSGELVPISGNSSGAFWHNGTYFTLELQGKSGEADEIAIATTLDPTSKLVVGCFGHSSDPIQALIEHAKTRVTQTGNLHVMEIIPNPGKEIADNRLVQRKKRPMSTVDLDPQMMQDILKDVELFFHKESQIWYEHTGRPWRHGYLLHGPPGTVTLSGLLNVLDGVNASEGRLVIMTTNHPEKLDPALYRAGRVERKFEISYASKDSCILTFKRLFGNDVCKRYTSEAIDRFAQAFQAQFPSKSRITTAELTKYCGQYRGRPDVAVEEFADWVKRGADKFVIPRDYAKAVDEEGVNIPEPFDSDLLLVRTSDLVDPNVGATSDMEVVTEVQPTAPASRGFFSAIANVFQDSGEYTDLASIQGALVNVDSDASLSEIPHGHLIETIPECELALMSPRPLPDDDDEFLYIV